MTAFAQGEVYARKIDKMPEGLPFDDFDKQGRPIIGHSESGHHHVLERAREVRVEPNPPAGMRILYALLDEPTKLLQDAGDPHGEHVLDAGVYEFRIAREYDPLMEQARMVAD